MACVEVDVGWSDPGCRPQTSSLQVRRFFVHFVNPRMSAQIHARYRCPELVKTVLDGFMGSSVADSLVELSLEYCRLGRRGCNAGPLLAHVLTACTNLSHLNLMGNQFRAQPAMQIFSALHSTKLVSLNLSWNLIGQMAMDRLSQTLTGCTSLTLLHLGGNKIMSSSSVASVIAANTSLRSLDLGRNELAAHGLHDVLSAMRGHTHISWLGLRSCGVGDEELQRVLEVLEQCEALWYLDVRHHRISDNGLAMLAQAVRKWPHLRHLDVGRPLNDDLGEMGVFALLDALCSRCEPTHLDVRYCLLRGTKMSVYARMLRGTLHYGAWEPRGPHNLKRADMCRCCEPDAVRQLATQ